MPEVNATTDASVDVNMELDMGGVDATVPPAEVQPSGKTEPEVADIASAAGKKKGASKAAAASAGAIVASDPSPPPPPEEETEDEELDVVAPAVAASQDDMVTIMIDEVPGMSNYETVGANGVMYQIKRGVPVKVPRVVVNVLKLAVLTHDEVFKDPITGDRTTRSYNRSSIPWRIVG